MFVPLFIWLAYQLAAAVRELAAPAEHDSSLRSPSPASLPPFNPPSPFLFNMTHFLFDDLVMTRRLTASVPVIRSLSWRQDSVSGSRCSRLQSSTIIFSQSITKQWVSFATRNSPSCWWKSQAAASCRAAVALRSLGLSRCHILRLRTPANSVSDEYSRVPRCLRANITRSRSFLRSGVPR
jgi:hypothetical protein